MRWRSSLSRPLHVTTLVVVLSTLSLLHGTTDSARASVSKPSSVASTSAADPAGSIRGGGIGDMRSQSAAASTQTWSIVPTPSPGFGATLLAVSCVTSTWCVAVGGSDSTLIEMFDGTSWLVAPSPGLQGWVLESVSCASQTMCVAVGSTPTGSQPLIETYDGVTWSLSTPAPSPAGAVSYLVGVSCASSSWCMAVGELFTSCGVGCGTSGPLVETYDGSGWSVAPSANDPGGAQLLGVSCTDRTFCVVVGLYVTGSVGDSQAQRLIETYDGTGWSVEPIPYSYYPVHAFDLAAISCTSRTYCMALGSAAHTNSYGVVLDYVPLIEIYDGTHWSLGPSPAQPSDNGGAFCALFFCGVSCSSPSFCAVADTYNTSTGDFRGVVYTYDGTNWSGGNDPGVYGFLFGVSCVGMSFCAAVGDQYDPNTMLSSTLVYQTSAAPPSGPDLGLSSIVAAPSPSVADCSRPVLPTVTVTLVDSANRPWLQPATVSLVHDPAIQVTEGDVITSSTGSAAFHVCTSQPGLQLFSALVNGQPLGLGLKYASIQFDLSLPHFSGHLDCGERVAQKGVQDGYEIPGRVPSAGGGVSAAA